MPDHVALRVALAEDAALLREGLAGILERAGHEVVASVGDADALLAYVRRERPDIVVTDVRMPPSHTDEGLRAAVAIRAEHPDIAGLAVPGMPIGSPGMEGPAPQPYSVLSVGKDGKLEVFADHRP